jgi:hypothetical protein
VIEESFTAPGLKEAKKTLDILKMSPENRRAYDNYIDNRRREISRYETGHSEGLEEGREEERLRQEAIYGEKNLPNSKLVMSGRRLNL